MKTIKKISCAIIVFALALTMCLGLASCGKKRGGTLLATYKGGEVYSSELLEWQSYFFYENIDDILSQSDMNAALNARNDQTTKFYVQMKAFRKLLEDKGILKLTEKGIKEYAKELKATFEEEYKGVKAGVGGYDFWKSVYHVSDDFINSYAEYELVSAQTEKYVMGNYGVTDEMIKEYWELHAVDYLDVPSYVFDIILVTVDETKMADADEWARAKAEAESYIKRINAGESFDAVKEDAIKNSTSEKIAKAYSHTEKVSKADCSHFTDLESVIEDINKTRDEFAEKNKVNFVENADPNGDKKEWALWYDYCNLINEATIKHTMPTLEIGQTNSEPIKAIMGYQIVKLVEITDDAAFIDPFKNEEVYNEIYNIIYADRWASGGGVAVDEFIADLEADYEIEIKYSYYEQYEKAKS